MHTIRRVRRLIAPLCSAFVTKPLLPERRLRDIFLMSRPPLLGEEGKAAPWESELYFQAGLDNARVSGRAYDLTEAPSEGHARQSQVGVIEDIECFKTKLHAQALPEPEVFGEIKIETRQMRPAKN